MPANNAVRFLTQSAGMSMCNPRPCFRVLSWPKAMINEKGNALVAVEMQCATKSESAVLLRRSRPQQTAHHEDLNLVHQGILETSPLPSQFAARTNPKTGFTKTSVSKARHDREFTISGEIVNEATYSAFFKPCTSTRPSTLTRTISPCLVESICTATTTPNASN